MATDVLGQPIGPTLKVKQSRRLIGCPKMSATNYQTKLCNIPEEWKHHTMASWRLLGREPLLEAIHRH